MSMIAHRPLAAAATCALALVVAACGGATTTASAPGAAGTAGKGADAFPASTLFFVDANADVNSSAWQKVRTVGARFPGYAKVEAKVAEAVSKTGQDGFSFAKDIQPWAGDEAAVGVLSITLAGGKPKPQFVAYLSSKDDAKATAAITGDGSAKKTGDYRGYAQYTADEAFIAVGKSAVLVSGDSISLKASIDAREGAAADRLSGSPLYTEALGTLPDDNVLVGYADGPKLAQLAGTAFEAAAGAGAKGLPPAQVDQALSRLEALRAIAFSAGADDNGFRLHMSTLLDQAKTKALKGVESSELALLDRAPADALLYAGTPGFGDTLAKSVADATAANPEVAQGIAGFEAMTGLSVTGDLLPLLSGELGLYVSGGAPAKGALLLLPKDPTAAAASLKKITAAVGKAGTSGANVPKFAPLPTGEGEIATVDGHDVSWLHDGDLIAIGFDTGGVPPAGGLASSDRFRSVHDAAKAPDKVGALLYADVPGLVALAQRSGAGQVPAEALANIQALGGVLAWSTQEDGVGKSELYVQVPSQG